MAAAVQLNALTFSDPVLPLPPSVCLSSVMAVTVHILTRDDEDVPALDLGTGFAFGPAVFSVMGFFMGVLWIDMIASEVGSSGRERGCCQTMLIPDGLSFFRSWRVAGRGHPLSDLQPRLASVVTRGPDPAGMGRVPRRPLRQHRVGQERPCEHRPDSLLRWCVASPLLFCCSVGSLTRSTDVEPLPPPPAGPLFNMLIGLALGFSARFAREGSHSMQVRGRGTSSTTGE